MFLKSDTRFFKEMKNSIIPFLELQAVPILHHLIQYRLLCLFNLNSGDESILSSWILKMRWTPLFNLPNRFYDDAMFFEISFNICCQNFTCFRQVLFWFDKDSKIVHFQIFIFTFRKSVTFNLFFEDFIGILFSVFYIFRCVVLLVDRSLRSFRVTI